MCLPYVNGTLLPVTYVTFTVPCSGTLLPAALSVPVVLPLPVPTVSVSPGPYPQGALVLQGVAGTA